MKKDSAKTLQTFYGHMAAYYGPTRWWPGDTPFEIAIGAILTQNTAWSNVEKAIINLKREKLLSPRKMLACPLETLETALRPSGYFRQKAKRVRLFCEYLLERYRGSLEQAARRPLEALRRELAAAQVEIQRQRALADRSRSPASPSAAKRAHHLRTVLAVTPIAAATAATD